MFGFWILILFRYTREREEGEEKALSNGMNENDSSSRDFRERERERYLKVENRNGMKAGEGKRTERTEGVWKEQGPANRKSVSNAGTHAKMWEWAHPDIEPFSIVINSFIYLFISFFLSCFFKRYSIS